MSTFLQLCQKVASESGTVSGDGRPTTVVGQTGRLGRIVRWTNDAWRNIQNSRSDWRWMRKELSGSIASGVQRYTATGGAGVGMGLTSFSHWRVTGEDERLWSIYRTASGLSDEGRLVFLDWERFYESQLRGTRPTNGKPLYFSIDDADQLVFSPTPNAAMTVRGWYRKGVQEMAADATEPEMPARFHDLVMWEALKLLGNFDEASVQQRAEWANNARILKFDLERDQLPQIRMCGPLA